jgi:hypothetical protein
VRLTRLAFCCLVCGATSPAAQAGEPDLVGRADRLLADAWKSAGVTPAAPADDAEFLRRATFDLVGRIPTAAEARAFLADRSPGKRGRAIDRLLASPGYARHWAAVWRHQLLPQSETQQFADQSANFEGWLQRELAANTPYDLLARRVLDERLIGRGQVSPALQFLAVAERKPEVLAANTARVFLGLNLDCAQCHDHPFARWTRQQFWDFAAFFARPAGPRAGAPAALELPIPGSRLVGTPRLPVEGKVRWPERLEGDTGRKVLAEWIASRSNSYFARNAVNRVWAQLFGAGLVEPLDDLSEGNPASHPELLDRLAAAFADSGYDLRWLLRTLAGTRAYRLASALPEGATQAGPRLFARAPVRGLSGEQLYDSLLTAAGLPLDDADPEQAARNTLRRAFLDQFRADRPAEAQQSILQALERMNGRLTRRAAAGAAAAADSPFLDAAGKLELLFLATLSRPPAPGEAAELLPPLRRSPGEQRQALADIFWALVNSTEFSVNH